MNKLDFLKKEFPDMLEKLSPEARGNWGVMNAQQMVEHMAESVSYATGMKPQTLHTPAEQLHKYKEFAMSDKEFKPNTRNALLPETPAPAAMSSIREAVDTYKAELSKFENYFNENKGAVLTNSIFGDLNFEEWTHLLHKHAVHHAKQFGLIKE